MGTRTSTPLTRTARRRWGAVGVALVAIGALCSTVLAGGDASGEADGRRRTFTIDANDLATRVRFAIERLDSFVDDAGTYVLGNPEATGAQAARWAQATIENDELTGLTVVGMTLHIEHADLADTLARLRAGEFGPLSPPDPSSFEIVPPGERPYYCVYTTELYTAPGTDVGPIGTDFCATDIGASVIAARDSGRGVAFSAAVGNTGSLLAVTRPLYRGGGIPDTLQARREAFFGAIGIGIESAEVLGEAVGATGTSSASLTYEDATVASLGDLEQAGDLTTTHRLGDGWTLRVWEPAPSDGVLATGSSVTILVIGVTASVLVGALAYLLGTSRERALRLVAARTDELRHQALHDGLTGLPNRVLLADRVEQLLVRARRAGGWCAALYVDLDGFKNINDTLGHAVGDELLQAVAGRFRGSLRDADTVGRMGGDEFVVLLDGVNLDASPELVAERLIEVMRQPFELASTTTPLRVTASVGIAIGDHDDPAALLRDADIALYQAKAAGRDRYVAYRPEMQSAISHRVELEFELRSALPNGEFWIAYQPLYCLEDLSLVGVEALLRWQHPDLGLVPPDEFVPLLERSGQIIEIGRWVLDTACRQMANWQRKRPGLSVSVNVSGVQLDDDQIVADVAQVLATSGLDPGSLIIEMTETSLMRDPARTAERLRQIKALGVEIAIDDFGTGYSSFAYLQQFPVDSLKIDRSFTSALRREGDSSALLNTLVQLGRALNLRTLAEGVETVEQVNELRSRKVDEAQGFLLSRPLSAAAFEADVLPFVPGHVAPAAR